MKKTFQVLNDMVRDGIIENYAIAGAIGATFYVEPFATQDIDALVMMPEAHGGLINEIPGWDYLRKPGLADIRGKRSSSKIGLCSLSRLTCVGRRGLFERGSFLTWGNFGSRCAR